MLISAPQVLYFVTAYSCQSELIGLNVNIDTYEEYVVVNRILKEEDIASINSEITEPSPANGDKG